MTAPPLGLIPHTKTPHELVAIRWAASPMNYPPSVDNMTGVIAGLDMNSTYGDCGPTSGDNHRRITTLAETGTQLDASLTEVLALYSASTNPPFDPQTGANDSGVQMPDLLNAMRKVGLGGEKIVGFGRLADTSDASVFTAIALFGAVLFAVDLQTAQQSQTRSGATWDYVPGSGEWGGHAIVAGAYDSATGDTPVFSWANRIHVTSAFRRHRLSEVWVPLWPSVVASDKFAREVDVAYLAQQFKTLTGSDWPAAVPAPTPAPAPTSSVSRSFTTADVALLDQWAAARHTGSNAKAAAAWLRGTNPVASGAAHAAMHGLTATSDRLEVYRDRADEWRWRRVARNGENIGSSGDGFGSRAAAKDAAVRANTEFDIAEVRVIEP